MTPWLDDGDVRLYHGDCLEVLRQLPDRSVHMCATSPPFYGLRDYGTGSWEGGDPDCDHATGKFARNDGDRNGVDGFGGNQNRDGHANMGALKFRDACGKCGARRVDRQIGLEETPDQWVERLVAVFREVRRVLRDDGTLWVEIGDSYASGGHNGKDYVDGGKTQMALAGETYTKRPSWLKQKDLLGQPWLLAFALRADGWYLRSEIVWSRPNPMPESVTDRPTKAHSTVFLLAKGQWKSRVVALADLHGEPVHVGNHVGSKNPNMWAHQFSVRFATAILDSAEFEDEFSLPALDSQIWQQRPDDVDGFRVAGLPVEHRAAVYAARLLSSHGTAKEFLCEIDRLGIALSEDGKFLVLGGESFVPLPPGVDRYGERSVAIHDSGEIGEFDFTAHTVKCSWPSGCSYFYDADAIREQFKPVTLNDSRHNDPEHEPPRTRLVGGQAAQRTGLLPTNHSGANARSVWTVPTEPTPFAHFATWPQALVRRMVLAGTSEKGCCPECGAPWARVTERPGEDPQPLHSRDPSRVRVPGNTPLKVGSLYDRKNPRTPIHVGWSPSCDHDAPPVPAVVLDPFAGSATTCLVARNHGRHAVGIELNQSYLEIAAKRLQQLSLLTVTEA